MYNEWFMTFAPEAFRATRIQTTRDVEFALQATGNMTAISPATIRDHPDILPTLRMSTCPPLAVDRLVGLSGVSANLVKSLELKTKLPSRMNSDTLDRELQRLVAIIVKMTDPDIFV